MSWYKSFERFSGEELHMLVNFTGGAALLVGFAVLLSAQAPLSGGTTMQTASTVLGTAQGVPPGYSDVSQDAWGITGPDQTTCLVNYSTGYDGGGYGYETLCRNQGTAQTYDFYTGIFSINPSATPAVGESKYLKSHYTPGGDERDVYVGPPLFQYNEYGDPTYLCGSYVQGNPWEEPVYTSYPVPTGDEYVAVDETTFSPFHLGDGNCYGYKHVPASLTAETFSAGTPVVVAPGIPLTLEWSCLPQRRVYGEYKTGQNWHSSGYWVTFPIYSTTVATGVSGGGPGFSASGLSNSRTVTAPAAAGTHEYTLTCNGEWNLPPIVISVTVEDGPIPPTTSITGNGTSGALTVEPGDSVDILAAFTAGTEPLAESAINGCLTPNKTNEDVNCQTAINSQGTLANRTYSFTPSEEGRFYFYPAVRTASLPWNNYNQKLTVTADCPASTQLKNGKCEPNFCVGVFSHATLCTGDADDVPGRTDSRLVDECTAETKCEWTCTEYGYEKAGDECKPIACADAHAINPPVCACDTANGWSGPKGGTCIAVPSLSISVAQNTVRPNTPALLSWSVGNLPEDGGIGCKITSSPSNVFIRNMPDPSPTAPTWSGTDVSTGNITGQTIFTLSCTNATSVSVTVNLIPSFIEI